jgi:hypothetical protein
MEIPAGRGCPAGEDGCVMLAADYVGTYCRLFNSYGQYDSGIRVKCNECLAAYPNGAVITITPKEGK